MASRGHIPEQWFRGDTFSSHLLKRDGPEQWLHGDTFQSNCFAGTHSRAMGSRGHIPEQWLHGDTFQSNGFAGTHSRAMGSRGYIPEQLRRPKYTSSLYRLESL